MPISKTLWKISIHDWIVFQIEIPRNKFAIFVFRNSVWILFHNFIFSTILLIYYKSALRAYIGNIYIKLDYFFFSRGKSAT